MDLPRARADPRLPRAPGPSHRGGPTPERKLAELASPHGARCARGARRLARAVLMEEGHGTRPGLDAHTHTTHLMDMRGALEEEAAMAAPLKQGVPPGGQ